MHRGVFIITSLFVFLGVSSATKGQNCSDTLYLKNGKVVFGTILDAHKRQYVIIKVHDSIDNTYLWTEVKYIHSCSYGNGYPSKIINLANTKKSKYFIIAELGESYIANNRHDTFSFTTVARAIVGCDFAHEISGGIGAGFYEYNNSNFIPVFLDFRRYNFLHNLVGDGLFYLFQGGYTICSGGNDSKGGANFSLALGEKKSLTNNFSLFGSFGVTFQRYGYYQIINGSNELKQQGFLLINLSIGVKLG